MPNQKEPDWKGGVDEYYANLEEDENTNLFAFVTHELWVCSDDDIVRVISRLTEVLLTRSAQRSETNG